MISAVTIRQAFPDDALALLGLAALDSARPLAEPVLVAEVEGELRAALSLHDGAVVADPFRRTAALIELLGARAAQIAAATPPRSDRESGGAWRWPLAARLSRRSKPASRCSKPAGASSPAPGLPGGSAGRGLLRSDSCR